MNTPRIAVVAASDNVTEMLKTILLARENEWWVEIRADYLPAVSSSAIATLAQAARGVNSIFTLRPLKYGGKFKGDKLEWIKLFKFALAKNFTFYDWDLQAVADFTEIFEENKERLILSQHDFTGTPTLSELQRIYAEMRIKQPAIIKFATMVNTEKDLQVLQQILTADPEQRKIIIGMGALGRISRIIYPLLGSFVTFAATAAGASAPGQIQAVELQKIFNEILK
jgi:3-dehydroquinate dehydratase-1